MESIFHFLYRAGGDALFWFGLLMLLGVSVSLWQLREVSFAFEAAGSEAGKGIEHTQEVQRVGLDGLAQGIGTDFGNGFADEGGGNFMGGLEGVDTLFFAGKVEGQFEAGAGFVEEAEFAEMFLVAAFFPATDGVVSEVSAVWTELLADGGVGEAVVEHFIELVAEGFGEAGDGAAATMGRKWTIGFKV